MPNLDVSTYYPGYGRICGACAAQDNGGSTFARRRITIDRQRRVIPTIWLLGGYDRAFQVFGIFGR